MTPDDEQIVREAYQMTRHGAPRSPHTAAGHRHPAPRAAIAQATSYLRSALTS